jgi:hypothetical protein
MVGSWMGVETSMATKQVMDRERSTVSVVAVGEAHAESIGAGVNVLAKPHAKKGEGVDFAVVARILSEILDAAKQRMVEAETAHQAELDDDAAVRAARDAAATHLYDHVVSLREMITGAYGGETTGKLFTGATPEDTVTLSRYAGDLQKKLGATKFPPSRIKGTKLDPADLAKELHDKRAALDAALKAVQREVREAQVTLQAKTEAIAAHDVAFSGVATTLSGLLTLAGKPDLADKVWPAVRRTGGVAEESETPADPAPLATPATPAAPVSPGVHKTPDMAPPA